MGLIEMIDTNAINHLSGLSDKSFSKAMAMIDRERREQKEVRNSEYVQRLKELCKDLKDNNFSLQLYDTYTEEWYDIDFDDIRIRKKRKVD